MATEGRQDGQALEILQPNIAYRTRLNVCVFFCGYFQSGGEVYRGWTWVSHSRRGQRGPVFLHPAELHRARYGEKKTPSLLIATRSMSFCNIGKETNACWKKWCRGSLKGWRWVKRKARSQRSQTPWIMFTHTSRTPLFSLLYPRPKRLTHLLQPLELLVLTLGKWSQRK